MLIFYHRYKLAHDALAKKDKEVKTKGSTRGGHGSSSRGGKGSSSGSGAKYSMRPVLLIKYSKFKILIDSFILVNQ